MRGACTAAAGSARGQDDAGRQEEVGQGDGRGRLLVLRLWERKLGLQSLGSVVLAPRGCAHQTPHAGRPVNLRRFPPPALEAGRPSPARSGEGRVLLPCHPVRKGWGRPLGSLF